jgi:hypothetical protein
MNYLAHGFQYIDEPYFVAGTATPDWLSAIDRKVRTSARSAALHVNDPDPVFSSVARGVARHHHDDAWFHVSRAFNELMLNFIGQLKRVLPGDETMRPAFLGHILVELLLDAEIARAEPSRLDHYYKALESLDPAIVQSSVNRLTNSPTDRLEPLLPRFVAERFLYDYLSDDKLLFRLNQVMRRVGLAMLPDEVSLLFPTMRIAVRDRRDELLREPENLTP